MKLKPKEDGEGRDDRRKKRAWEKKKDFLSGKNVEVAVSSFAGVKLLNLLVFSLTINLGEFDCPS